MKKSVTLRLDTKLLADTRRCAVLENRTLTNFVETVLKQRVGEMAPIAAEYPDPADEADGPTVKKPARRKA